MKVSEAIDQLAVGDTVWVKAEVNYKNKTESFPICCDLVTRSFWICDDDELSLTKPQAEKVEVPEFVAEWIDYAKKKGHGVIESAQPWGLYGAEWSKADRWIKDNEEIYARAFMDGYTVKPKRWVVRTSSAYFEQFSGDSNHPFNFDATHNICVALTFNDSAKAEAVATLIDGSVEEV